MSERDHASLELFFNNGVDQLALFWARVERCGLEWFRVRYQIDTVLGDLHLTELSASHALVSHDVYYLGTIRLGNTKGYRLCGYGGGFFFKVGLVLRQDAC